MPRGCVLFSMLTLVFTFHHSILMPNLCTQEEATDFVDITSARIEKSTIFQYDLEMYDTPIQIIGNISGLSLKGNFTKLTIRNKALNQIMTFWGEQMTINIPSHYILTKTSTPNLEVQILHKTDDNQKSTHKYLMLSEMYMVSKFKHRIETLLHPYFNPNLSNGHIIETSKIIKTLQEFPMLMYKGTADTQPCRTDLLCLLRRQYRLISEEDFEIVKQTIQSKPKISNLKPYQQKKLYEIEHMGKRNKIESKNEEL